MKLTRQHFIVFLILITEVLGFSLVLPFLPIFAQDMGASAFVVGLLLTTFSLFQFISAPIAGSLSDRYGRKPMLIISQIATLVSFLVLGFADSLWMLFLSRAVDGLFGSNATIAKAYLSDITPDKDRSKVFGISGVAFAIGFMIGPMIGGTIAQTDYSLPSFIAAGITLISIVLTILALPETVKNPKSILGRLQKKTRIKIKLLNTKQIIHYFNNKAVNQQLIEFSMYTLSMAIFNSNFAIFARQKFNATTQQIGFSMTVIGATSILFRGYLLPKLIDHFQERHLERVGVSLMIVGLIVGIVADSYTQLLVMITIFATGAGMNYPLMMGDISRSVDKNEQGAIIGVANSLDSMSHIVGPLLGGYLLSSTFPESMLLATIASMSICLYLIFREHKPY
ncbi:MAG: Permease of the major facilitator superfamily [Microgenomates bacterium 39_7]|nr:MAG: Permease of the major facilitator superfamily [Microgenomates bacterium 39_7]